MRSRERYTAIYERDEAGWWATRIREVPGCVTQGRTIEQARRRIREALSLFIGPAATKVNLVSKVTLPIAIRRKIDLANAARRRAEVEGAVARQRTIEVARLLAAEG